MLSHSLPPSSASRSAKSADALAAESTQQLAQSVSGPRSRLNRALSHVRKLPVSDKDAATRRRRAGGSRCPGSAARVRAAGRPAAADAMQMADALRDAPGRTISRRSGGLSNLASGKLSLSPLETITREQAGCRAGREDGGSRGDCRPNAEKADRKRRMASPIRSPIRCATPLARPAVPPTRSASTTIKLRPRPAATKASAGALDRAAHLAIGGSRAGGRRNRPASLDAAAQKKVTEADSRCYLKLTQLRSRIRPGSCWAKPRNPPAKHRSRRKRQRW